MLPDDGWGALRSRWPGARTCTASQPWELANVNQAAKPLSCAIAAIGPLALFRSV